MDWLPLNLELMRQPVNWVLVALIVMLAGLALHYVVLASQAQPQE